MRYRPRLATLGVAALMIGLAPVAAFAQVQTYYHAGAWQAFSGRTGKGGAVCGVSSNPTPEGRQVSIRFDIGGTDTRFTATKPDWSIPDNAHVTVVMQIGLNTPWTFQATGHGHSIDWTLDPNGIQAFDRQFRAATSMTLTFPDGNEPPWTLPLTGSSAISDTFGRCVRDLTRQVHAAQPPVTNSAPAQGATQPYTAPANGNPNQPTGNGGQK